MAQTKITDLDALVGTKKVKAAGKVYDLPADCPVSLILQLEYYAEHQEELDNAAAVRELYAQVLELFQVHQPGLERLPIGITALLRAVPAIYGDEAEEEGGDRPSKAGTRSTKTRARRKSASSS